MEAPVIDPELEIHESPIKPIRIPSGAKVH